jgi:chemotaxis protein methyltransferase CheR
MTRHTLFEDKDYLNFRDLIQERTGMLIGESRRNFLARLLKENVKNAEYADIDQYFSCLNAAGTDSEIWDELIKRITIGETNFFRHLEQIDALRRNILPDLIARHWTDRSLYLWSAGCATGEEPYTLAILLRQLLPDIERWRILILATDINRQALARAAIGRYREWSFRETEPVIREKYFSRKGDYFTLDPSIRQMVTFSYLNLAEDKYPSSANYTNHLDLILCRNVSIYLPQRVVHEIADRFYKCLSPGGWLMVGPSETQLEIYSKFQMLIFYGSIVYQKIGNASTSSPVSPREELSIAPHHAAPYNINITSVVPPAAQLSIANAASPAAKIAKDEVLEIEPDKDLLAQGESYIKQHRYNDARETFLTYLAKRPGSVEVLYRMARIESNTGRLDEAQNWAEQALVIDPMRHEVHYTLAIIHQARGEVEAAIGRLKKVIYLDPDFVLAHLSLFYLYERDGRKKEAERHRSIAISLASRLSPDTILAGTDDLTAGQMLTMARTIFQRKPD